MESHLGDGSVFRVTLPRRVRTSDRKIVIGTAAKGGVLAGIEETMEMKPEEYWTYFEDFIFIVDKESGQKNPFAEVKIRE